MDAYVVVYAPFVTVKGHRIYASSYGFKVFRLLIPKEKYRHS